MAIGARVPERIGVQGTVAFLCFRPEPGGRGVRGALFLVNERVEPLDFCFTRVGLPDQVLWRESATRRRAVLTMLEPLLGGCPGTPDVLVAPVDEMPAEVFAKDLEIDVPHCRLTATQGAEGAVGELGEVAEQLDGPLVALWAGAPADADSVAGRLLRQLAGHDLLLEPFERAAQGLDEAYSSS